MNAKNIKVITKTVMTNRASYVMVEFETELGVRYGTINKQFIKNGKLTKQMRGFDLQMEETVGEALDSRIKHDEIDDLIDAGMDSFEAIIRVHGKRNGWSQEKIDEMVDASAKALKNM